MMTAQDRLEALNRLKRRLIDHIGGLNGLMIDPELLASTAEAGVSLAFLAGIRRWRDKFDVRGDKLAGYYVVEILDNVIDLFEEAAAAEAERARTAEPNVCLVINEKSYKLSPNEYKKDCELLDLPV